MTRKSCTTYELRPPSPCALIAFSHLKFHEVRFKEVAAGRPIFNGIQLLSISEVWEGNEVVPESTVCGYKKLLTNY
jgi:hypothetical protein